MAGAGMAGRQGTPDLRQGRLNAVLNALDWNWPKWGPDPHNPYSGKDRPAFDWKVHQRYVNGYVDADGKPTGKKPT